MNESPNPIVNANDAEEINNLSGERFGGFDKILTPTMRERGGSLGVALSRVPPGRTMCPFHYHQLEDEVFYVMSGTGVLRYGESIYPVRPGDCISCPAGTRIAHQIGNNGDEDLIYLAIGPHEPNEVGVYPDSGKVLVRSLERVGYLEKVDYMDGEPESPKIFELANRA